MRSTVPRQKFSPNRVISEKRVFPPPIPPYSSLHYIILRTLLVSISGNRLKGPDLYLYERGFLLELSTGGAIFSKIFKDYRVLKSTTRLTIILASQRIN